MCIPFGSLPLDGWRSNNQARELSPERDVGAARDWTKRSLMQCVFLFTWLWELRMFDVFNFPLFVSLFVCLRAWFMTHPIISQHYRKGLLVLFLLTTSLTSVVHELIVVPRGINSWCCMTINHRCRTALFFMLTVASTINSWYTIVGWWLMLDCWPMVVSWWLAADCWSMLEECSTMASHHPISRRLLRRCTGGTAPSTRCRRNPGGVISFIQGVRQMIQPWTLC